MSDSSKPNKIIIENLIANKRAHEQSLTAKNLVSKIISGNVSGLSEGITLVESTRKEDQLKAQELLKLALPHSGKSIRIGITGVPGVGKSTFIESLGIDLIKTGKKVAVLAIDPSSEKSGGSILGDKTRMVDLSSDKRAFIRPSATAGSLGGVARKTRESILLCEAAGFDVVLVETVGVGQSEIAVHSMTDFFLLLMLAGAGDELQGIKRGIMEMADSILITKTDGKNVKMANLARTEYKNALHLFPAYENGWTPQIETISSIEAKGIKKVWDIIESFQNHTKTNGTFNLNREKQQVYWMMQTVNDNLIQKFNTTKGITEKIEAITKQLQAGEITSFQASELILSFYYEQ